MTIKIKQMPESERPYEKLELYGESKLSNAELLAIIIKSGRKDATSVEIANEILKLNKNINNKDLNFLREMSIEELMQIRGIGKVKAIQIKAVCELSKRMNKPTNYKKIQVKGPGDIAKILMNDLRFEKTEIAQVIILDSKNYIVKIKKIATGSTNLVNLSIKEILSDAIKINAPKIILVHNHPSGISTPSKKDYELTEKVETAAKILGIELLDHIVIGNMEYTSIKSKINLNLDEIWFLYINILQLNKKYINFSKRERMNNHNEFFSIKF